jgi:hypothetical protein
VDISSVSTPAISFVITAITLARHHQRLERQPSILPRLIGFPPGAVESQIKGRQHPFPSLIASHSQLEERTRELQLNGIA